MSKAKVVEGIFAINKPPSISSAQVVRDLQKAFNPSELFAPWLAAEEVNRARKNRSQKNRQRDKRCQVKIGHGGTLDPLATGVLIIGVGKGTKHLQNFLSCTKTYEAVLLFGAATDTYDTKGRVLSKAPYAHITREKVKKALDGFRGNTMQRPPIYSALSMHGKRLYEYAREGREPPAEIKERPVTVEELEISEWLDPGRHTYKWPTEDSLEEEKRVAEKLLHLGDANAQAEFIDERAGHQSLQSGTKRKAAPIYNEYDLLSETGRNAKRQAQDSEVLMSGGLPSQPASHEEPPMLSLAGEPQQIVNSDKLFPAAVQFQSPHDTMTHSETVGSSGIEPPAQRTLPFDSVSSLYSDTGPPAVKLRMTVASGFYVRSLCHDLGKMLGSFGVMAALVRTRQGDFEIGKNVLDYEDLERGEHTWGPKVANMLDVWQIQGARETEQSITKDQSMFEAGERVVTT